MDFWSRQYLKTIHLPSSKMNWLGICVNIHIFSIASGGHLGFHIEDGRQIKETNLWNGFLIIKLVRKDTYSMFLSHSTQEIHNFAIFKMAAGGHFGFCPLAENAHTFGRGIGAHFLLNAPRYQNPPSNQPLLSMVTGPLILTLL